MILVQFLKDYSRWRKGEIASVRREVAWKLYREQAVTFVANTYHTEAFRTRAQELRTA
jgi:hypothetical protein